MMPFIFGDVESLPLDLRGYLPLIQAANYGNGTTAYLTIHESDVQAGKCQRRPGIHTDGTSRIGWGGGGWGGSEEKKGIYIASSDGQTRIWDQYTKEVDNMGQLLDAPNSNYILCEANRLYWLTDRTPHEALASEQNTHRQFFRLVADEVGGWWEKHSTANPLGVKPNCTIVTESKFN